MSEWRFPNAIAESVKRDAFFRGQHANRLEIRDWGDKWPEFVRAPRHQGCPVTGGVTRHEPLGRDPFCSRCGVLVEG